MLRITRTLVRRFWGIFAFLVIFLAGLVVIGRELTPQITQYKPEIETYLSTAMGVTVHIESVQAEWEGLTPEIRLRGLELTNDENQSILSVVTAVAELSLVRSLVNWQLVWGNIELVKVRMGFRQNEKLTWSLVGVPSVTAARNDIGIDDPLDVFLLGRRIELRDADVAFEFHTGHYSQVTLPHLLLQNRGDFHRLSSNISVDRNKDVLTLVIEGQGDPRETNKFSAKGYLRLQDFELDKALAALPGELWQGLPNQEWRKGHQLNFETWFTIAPGMEITTHGRMDVGELPVALSGKIPFPDQSGANFAGKWQANGAWQFTLRDVLLGWGDIQSPSIDVVLTSTHLGDPVYVRTKRIDIEQWLNTLTSVGLVDGKLAEHVEILQPKGILNNLQLVIEGTDLAAVSLQANLENISVESWNGAPQLINLNGYVDATPYQGFVDLYSDNHFSMFYPIVFTQPMVFDSAMGRVNWTLDYDQGTVSVHSGLMSVKGDMGIGNGYFSLFVPFDFGSQPEELIVQVGVQDTSAEFRELFTPYTLPQPLTDWLAKSIRAGEIPQAGFIYRGGFTRDAFKNTSIQLHADVEHGELAYHEDWPAISHVNGEVWLNDDTVDSTIDTARFLDSQVLATSVSVTPNDNAKGINLIIDGQLHGDASDGMRLFKETSLRELVGDRLDVLQLTGNMQASAHLEIPLFQNGFDEIASESISSAENDLSDAVPINVATSHKEQKISLLGVHRVKVNLTSASMEIPDAKLAFTNVQGELNYHEKNGIGTDGLTAMLWGFPLTIAVEQSKTSSGQGYDVQVAGRSSIAAVNEWLKSSELEFLSGETNYTAELHIPLSLESDGGTSITVNSQLEGVQIDLPEPFGKKADTAKSLAVNIPINEASPVYNIKYDNTVHAVMQFRSGNVSRLAIALGDEAALPSRNQFTISGKLTRFDFVEWQKTYERYQAYQIENQKRANDVSQKGLSSSSAANERNLLPTVDVHFDEFLYEDYAVDDLHLTAVKDNAAWQLHLESATVLGNVNLFDDSSQPIQLRLDHLFLTNTDTQLLDNVIAENSANTSDGQIDNMEENSNSEDTGRAALNDIIAKNEKIVNKDPLRNIDPATLPAMDIVVKSFKIDEEDMGSWSFVMRPAESGVMISQLRATVKGAQIAGVDGSGASLWWNKEAGGQRSRFAGKVASDQIGKVLTAWGQAELINADAAQFTASVSWAGSPAAISTLGISGDVTVLLENGAFSNSEDQQGAGGALLQLISFFNVDSWLRRLRFDFSDLGRKGVPFNDIAGTLTFDQGKVLVTQPMIIKMPSGKFQMTGVVDLVAEEVDARLIATLPVGGNLTVVTAFAAGLPAALGVYVVSKIFEKQMNKVASLRYHVNGSLNDPDLKFERLFDDKVLAPESSEVSQSEAAVKNQSAADLPFIAEPVPD